MTKTCHDRFINVHSLPVKICRARAHAQEHPVLSMPAIHLLNTKLN